MEDGFKAEFATKRIWGDGCEAGCVAGSVDVQEGNVTRRCDFDERKEGKSVGRD